MITMTVTAEEGHDQRAEVKADIDRFEQWFMKQLKNGDPLTRHERAIINDYLGWKLQADSGLAKEPGV